MFYYTSSWCRRRAVSFDCGTLWRSFHLYSSDNPDRIWMVLTSIVYLTSSQGTTKPAKWPVHPAKTLISLWIRPVWSESSLSVWRNFGPLTILRVHGEDWSDWVGAHADLSLRWAHAELHRKVQLMFVKHADIFTIWPHREVQRVFVKHTDIFTMWPHCKVCLNSRHLSRCTTKPTKWSQRPAKTQISLASAQSDQSFCCLHEERLDP